MSSEFKRLEAASVDTMEKLNKFRIGASSYRSTLPIDERIVHLIEKNNILRAKLNIINLHCHQMVTPKPPNGNITDLRTELLDQITSDDLEDKALQTSIFGQLSQLMIALDEADPKFNKYTQEIKSKYDAFQQVNYDLERKLRKQTDILKENLEVTKKIISRQREYSAFLIAQNERYQKAKEKSFGTNLSAYTDKIDLQLQKLNFMQMLIKRLLLSPNFELSNENLPNIFETSRKVWSMKNFENT